MNTLAPYSVIAGLLAFAGGVAAQVVPDSGIPLSRAEEQDSTSQRWHSIPAGATWKLTRMGRSPLYVEAPYSFSQRKNPQQPGSPSVRQSVPYILNYPAADIYCGVVVVKYAAGTAFSLDGATRNAIKQSTARLTSLDALTVRDTLVVGVPAKRCLLTGRAGATWLAYDGLIFYKRKRAYFVLAVYNPASPVYAAVVARMLHSLHWR
ncbi:MAG: hypothetical protein ACRYFX_26915 [Janthinobacterium lividum]